MAPTATNRKTAAARSTADRAADSNALEWTTRLGFVGFGILHLAIAWLAVQLAVEHKNSNTDQSGAFQLLAHQPLGKVLLIIIAVGLAAMAVWQLLTAAVGYGEERDEKKRTVQRIGSLCRAIVYALLLWTDIKVIVGKNASSSGSQQKATGGVLAHSGGRWLIGLIGLIVIGVGIGLLIFGAKKGFEKTLALGSASRSTRRSVVTLGQIGYITKGIAYGIVGVLLVQAALADDASRSKGLDGAIHTVAGKPYGQVLLIVVAIGLAAFGLFCFAQAKYRKI